MRIDGLLPMSIAGLQEAPELLQRLNVGDMIRAQVLEITSGELLLKLFDGTSIKASAPKDLEVAKGQVLDFTVVDKNEKQLFIETVKKGMDVPQAALEKEILKLGMPADAKTVEIAKELQANGIKPAKEALTKIADSLKTSVNIDVQKAVFLYKNSVQPTEKNISALSRLAEGRVRISTELSGISEALINKAQLSTLEELIPKLFNNITPNTVKNDTQMQKVGLTPEDQLNTKLPQDDNIPDFNINPDKAAAVSQKIVEVVLPSALPNKAETPNLQQELPKLVPEFKELLPDILKEKAPEILKQVINNINTANNPLDLKEVIKSISHTVSKALHVVNAIKKELDSAGLRLNAGELDSDSIKKTFTEILEKLDSVRKLSEASQPALKEVTARAENLQNDIRFMNDIYRHSTYLQLPLNVFDRQATGELYVLKKSRGGKRIDPENTTVFISLDTQNLGRFESLISIKGKSLTLNVRLEDEEAIKSFKDHFKELYNSLLEKGYKLSDIRYRLITEQLNILNTVRNARETESFRTIDLRI